MEILHLIEAEMYYSPTIKCPLSPIETPTFSCLKCSHCPTDNNILHYDCVSVQQGTIRSHYTHWSLRIVMMPTSLSLLASHVVVMNTVPGIILWMRPANERRRYNVTSSLIGWAHSQNDPCSPIQSGAACNVAKIEQRLYLNSQMNTSQMALLL